MGNRIYSVGYEGLTLDALIERLQQSKVATLVDVRLNASSRVRGYSKNQLRERLASVGIDYRHEPRLGNPPENRASFRSGDGSSGRDVMRHRLTNGSRAALEEVVELARSKRIAVLCVERTPNRCHREVITEMAKELEPELEVLNIL